MRDIPSCGSGRAYSAFFSASTFGILRIRKKSNTVITSYAAVTSTNSLTKPSGFMMNAKYPPSDFSMISHISFIA